MQFIVNNCYISRYAKCYRSVSSDWPSKLKFTAAQSEEKGSRCWANHGTSAIVGTRASYLSTTLVTYSGLYKEVGEET